MDVSVFGIDREAHMCCAGEFSPTEMPTMPKAIPEDADTEVETITSADGTTIAFKRTESGPPLVLVHGAGLDHDFWDLPGVRPALAENETVSAVDRRGRGGSGDAVVYELEREIEDVVAVVESIDDPVTLFGHSYGGLCALEAAERTDTLQSLVLYEPFVPEESYPIVEELLGKIQALLADGEREQALITDVTAMGMPEGYTEELRSKPSRQELVDATHTIPREFGQLIEYEFDTGRFAELTTPTLLVTGGKPSAS